MEELDVEFEPAPQKGFVCIRVHGDFTLKAAQMVTAQADVDHAGLNRLWDFRAASLTSWTADDMRFFVHALRMRASEAEGRKMAAVVSRDADYGMGRMWEMLSEDALPVTQALFRDMDEAVAWICSEG